MVEIFSQPFMQRALIGGIGAAILLGWLGVFIISRKMSFIGAGISHSSLAFIALGIVAGWPPLLTALGGSVILAVILYWLDQKTTIARDTAIGIIFAAGMALGVVLLQFHHGYAPELMTFLFGNILAVDSFDLAMLLIIGLVILLVLIKFQKAFTFITIDPEGAKLAGIKTAAADLVMYIITALAVVLSIKLVGIVLVSALLVIPAATAKSTAKTFRTFQFLAIVYSVLIVIAGLIISYYANLPSGASIVLTGAAVFILIRAWAAIKKSGGKISSGF